MDMGRKRTMAKSHDSWGLNRPEATWSTVDTLSPASMNLFETAVQGRMRFL